jgi:hypothetical protein
MKMLPFNFCIYKLSVLTANFLEVDFEKQNEAHFMAPFVELLLY